ncbi:uncharacterized protein LOC121603182 [Anopheles merus]|uniref:uncharacterized protein LOC121599374 n=1 Tax=Anopheles merus TaxID=30066 RepID=UPI001BE47544|nr:uncharacterized protein LOC121599374 [Anopheles merus]XP_041787821.1 uncharacterized protein LOC121603182 [Anopheles merus]
MNVYCLIFALCLLFAVVSSEAETGFYVPKAYYTIDEHGYKSPLIYIDNIPQIFQRTRRSAQLPPVPNFGFPVNFPAFQFPNPAQGGNFQSVSITSGGPSGLNNRFDEHGQSAPATTINTFSSQNGHVTQMTHHIDKDGKVTTHTNNKKN